MITRRKLIQNSVAAGLVFPTSQILSSTGVEAALAPTPDCGSFPSPTPRQTAGPFFLPDSPERHDFSGDGPGAPMFIAGFVVDTSCTPIVGAIVELWHANSEGDYDNRGYLFRGHVRSSDNGAYAFQTIRPGRYGSRTPHYHLKVFVDDRRVLTTQLYFPDAKSNVRDGLYDPNLLMRLRDEEDAGSARFDLIIPV